MKISGNTIVLRPLEKVDLELKIRWYNDPQVNQFLLLEERLVRDKTLKWFDAISQDRTRMDLIIENDDSEPVGIAGLVNIDKNNRTAESFIVIGETAYWGRGVMIEALELLLKWTFDNLALEKIWALALPTNVASIVSMKKLGYQIEGTLRKEKYINGDRMDILRLGLLRKDFEDFQKDRDQ